MTNGRDTLAAIETSINDLQAQEQRLQSGLEAANANRAALVAKRIEAIRALADVRTRNAVADGVIDRSDRLSENVASLLSARQKTIDNLKQRRADAQAQHRDKLAAHSRLASRIADLEQRLDATAEIVKAGMTGDPAQAKVMERAEAAHTMWERAREKAQRAHDDRMSRGAPYEFDPLFMYLWRRKFGTSDYTAWSLIKWLDGRVARLIDYHDARANYAVLLQIPPRLDAHVERLGEKARITRADLDALVAEKIRETAGSDLIADLEAARADYRTENGELDHLADEIAEIGAQLNRYAEGQDHAFRRAVALTTEFLEDERVSVLRTAARETKSPTDDEIVARIAGVDDEIDDLSEKIENDRNVLERLFKKKSELMRIASEFRRRQYDDPGSVFVPEGAGQMILQELLRGAIDAADYWARTRSQHRWRSRPGDSYRRRSNSWPMGDMDFDWGERTDDHYGDDNGDFYTDDRF